MRLAFAVLVTGAFGCSKQPTPFDQSPLSQPALIIPDTKGFPLNGAAYSRSVTPVDSIYQTETEVFLLHPATGGVKAWSMQSAPQMKVGWPASFEEHDAMAKDYFAAIGIPASELGSMYHYRGGTGNTPAGQLKDPDPTPIGFSTSFDRSLGGFPVVESIASVQLNSKSVPVALSIFWPDAPDVSVMQSAKGLAQLLKGNIRLLPNMPNVALEDGSATVVLHHSLPESSEVIWFASIRARTNSDKISYLDFDSTGRELDVYSHAGGGMVK